MVPRTFLVTKDKGISYTVCYKKKQRKAIDDFSVLDHPRAAQFLLEARRTFENPLLSLAECEQPVQAGLPDAAQLFRVVAQDLRAIPAMLASDGK